MNILSSIKDFMIVNDEVCLFGLILKNESDIYSIDIYYLKLKKQ